MRRVLSFGPALAVLVASVAVMIGVPAAIRRAGDAQARAHVILARQSLDDDDVLERLNHAARNVAIAVEPSVVHIDVVSADEAETFVRGSTGSGWVFDSAGHIVTNAHVVRGAQNIRIQCFDGRLVPVNVVGMDAFTDIAVLKATDPDGLVPSRRATGLRPQQGERVYAFGSPFGFKFSMSEGIVSGLGRSARAAMEFGGYSNFIQTDAAVNPGNSGGPLVDIKGRVIGMNVAIANAPSESRGPGGGTQAEGQSAGISFAIPLATIESVVPQLIEKGTVSRGFLGVEFRSGRGAERIHDGGKFVGLGVRLNEVRRDGAAYAAGIRRDDVLMAVNGVKIDDSEVMRAEISALRPGETVTLRVWSVDRFKEVPVLLGERPREATVSDAANAMPYRLGFTVDERNQGLTVVGVFRNAPVVPDSPGDRAGLKRGTVIVSVGQTPVATNIEFIGALVDQGLLDGKSVELTVRDVSESAGTQSTVRLQLND